MGPGTMRPFWQSSQVCIVQLVPSLTPMTTLGPPSTTHAIAMVTPALYLRNSTDSMGTTFLLWLIM